ncbi:hypothetical protein DCAR_0206599 [Daucus carota subsp. sativus]|uniref:Uncharacterized protein n=1 Tax=Daucus carota subsp. sativus TaxID=79200 RepID=A0A166DB38_DAUCS|nr:hypothetical protein DCAR_0206599 [Daucus carota subsp. sativus]
MKRFSVFYCCLFLVILLVHGVLANTVENDNVLGSKKDDKATGAEVESSKPRWFGGGFYWGRPGGWYTGGGSGAPGRAGCGGNGGGPGGGAGGCGGNGGVGGYGGGMPGWGGRGGNGGGAGGGAGGAGGYPGGTPGQPGWGGRGGDGGSASGSQGGGGSYSMPNPNDPRCGNIQMAQIPNGYLISYDCGNCNYQYTIDYNGMTPGNGRITCY